MKQKALFEDNGASTTSSLSKEISEKSFPDITVKNILSDQFIHENGMFGLRMMLKKARKKGDVVHYQRALMAEINMKKGKNTLKNNLRHVLLWDTIGKGLSRND